MKITKKNDRDFRTVYMCDGKIAMHLYAPEKDINKKHKDYLCYLHDRVVPGIANAKLTVTIEDNPNKAKRGDKEKFGKMFRVDKVTDAYTALTEICKCLPKKETPTAKTPKTPAAPKTQTASKKGKKNELVFKEVKHEPANA